MYKNYYYLSFVHDDAGKWRYDLLKDGTVVLVQYVLYDEAYWNPSHMEVPQRVGDFRVSAICEGALDFAAALEVIEIPNSITQFYAENEPSYGCTNLKRFSVKDNHPTLKCINGVLFRKSDNCLISYPKGKTESVYTIPDNILGIGDYAFAKTSLVKIIIPDSVVNIGASPFAYTKKLTDIIVSPDNPGIAFFDGIIYSKKDKRLVECLKTTTTEINIPQGILIIGENAFYDCTGLKNIHIPDSVKTIGENAFFGCTGLNSISIPSSVETIEESAFRGCIGLNSIRIPNSVKTIGEYTFGGCNNLTIIVERDSYAAEYCHRKQLMYSYPDSFDWLYT